MEVKTKKHFSDILKNLTLEIIDDEKELDEMTVTADIDGYMTPFAFQGEKGKRKKREISTNSTGYKIIDETIDDKDLVKIKALIRATISDVIRDIWLKRTAWNR